MQYISLVIPSRRPSSDRGKLIPYSECDAAICDAKLEARLREIKAKVLRMEAKIVESDGDGLESGNER